MQKRRTALVVGATGFVGKQLVNMLLQNEHYESVTVFVRKTLNINNEKLKEYIIDFEHLDNYQPLFQVNDVFCCLGTTIKIAKSKEAFKKVDFHYPLQIAKIANRCNVEKFLVISAMGANENSKFFYNKVKGELETNLKKINLRSLFIFRPSLLLGERKEFRLGERVGANVMKAFNFLLVGPLKSYRGITGHKVARAMMNVAISERDDKVAIYKSDKIQNLG
jgi:uncharacterized protein YbjT (DUF2867 family)